MLAIALLSLAIALLCCAQSGLFAPVNPLTTPNGSTATLKVASEPEASVSSSYPSDTLISESRLYSITRSATYTNTGANAVSGELQLSVIPSLNERQSHCQQVLSQQFSPEPSRYESDAQGNTWAIFTSPSLPKGKQFTVRQEAQVRIANLTRAVDASAWPVSPASENEHPTPPAKASEKGGTIQADLQSWLDKAVGTETHPWYRIVHLYDSVRSLDFRLDDQPRPLEKVLQMRQAQCLDAATLMTALLRQEGWQARVVSGLYLRPENPRDSIYHAWSEVQLPELGWLPLDPTMGRFPDARSSRLAQLDCYYLTLWLGDCPQTMASWRGSQGSLAMSFDHTLLELHAHRVPGSDLVQAIDLYAQALSEAKEREGDRSFPGRNATLETAEEASVSAELPPLDDQINYSALRQTLDNLPVGTRRDWENVRFYTQTKQLLPLWRTLTDSLKNGATLDNVLYALNLVAESGDWESLHLLSQEALELFGDEPSLLGARFLACFHIGDQDGLQSAIQRLQRLTSDGYAQAMWGNMCLDAYRYQEALEHWRQALQIGLPEQERAQCQEQIAAIGKLLQEGQPPEDKSQL